MEEGWKGKRRAALEEGEGQEKGWRKCERARKGLEEGLECNRRAAMRIECNRRAGMEEGGREREGLE